MVVRHKQVEPGRYRESYGRYYEDFNVGDIYEHRPGRTITEVDNTWFTLLTMNTHPLHFDAHYAKKTEFGRPLVNSALTLSIVAGMSVSDLSQKAIANLGWENIKLPAPVFAGDTLYAESEVLAKRESNSRPTQGIVSARTTGMQMQTAQWSSRTTVRSWCQRKDTRWMIKYKAAVETSQDNGTMNTPIPDPDDALILDSIDRFLERDVRPVVRELEANDVYPQRDRGSTGRTRTFWSHNCTGIWWLGFVCRNLRQNY